MNKVSEYKRITIYKVPCKIGLMVELKWSHSLNIFLKFNKNLAFQNLVMPNIGCIICYAFYPPIDSAAVHTGVSIGKAPEQTSRVLHHPAVLWNGDGTRIGIRNACNNILLISSGISFIYR